MKIENRQPFFIICENCKEHVSNRHERCEGCNSTAFHDTVYVLPGVGRRFVEAIRKSGIKF